MATFILRGSLPQAAMAGYMAKPEDRTGPLSKLVEAAGGQLRAFYFTSGDSDFLMIIDAPGPEVVASAAMVAGAQGMAGDFCTVQAFTGEEFKQMAAKAASISGQYAAPGG